MVSCVAFSVAHSLLPGLFLFDLILLVLFHFLLLLVSHGLLLDLLFFDLVLLGLLHFLLLKLFDSVEVWVSPHLETQLTFKQVFEKTGSNRVNVMQL